MGCGPTGRRRFAAPVPINGLRQVVNEGGQGCLATEEFDGAALAALQAERRKF
jgi:hypothetical protein